MYVEVCLGVISTQDCVMNSVFVSVIFFQWLYYVTSLSIIRTCFILEWIVIMLNLLGLVLNL